MNMKKYNALAQDANNNAIQIFVGVDEETFNEFMNDCCDTEEEGPRSHTYRWLKDRELPEYDIPYRCQGWIIRFCEA